MTSERLLRLLVRMGLAVAGALLAFVIASWGAQQITSFALGCTAAAFASVVVARDNMRAALQLGALLIAVAVIALARASAAL